MTLLYSCYIDNFNFPDIALVALAVVFHKKQLIFKAIYRELPQSRTHKEHQKLFEITGVGDRQ